jgi:3D (Asp-Asp-Asp) domain-containing protein
MKNLAGGTCFLGAIALSVTVLFYFQPTAEAMTLTEVSQNNQQTQFNNQDIQPIRQLEQTHTSKQNPENKNEKQLAAASFRATGYCLKGRTASGGSVRRGVIAADPRVLPLGSRIQLNAGAYSGTYTVADTGGAVKGRKLDIWMPSCAEAVRFGNRGVMVSKLNRKG